ncbi:hypothetical protein BX600DRAFT_439127 [Xylariales sp. PMI_506]|nr:hypothetical protein BX600DRAFT_439127 [Xylariales sp. PMI_506]
MAVFLNHVPLSAYPLGVGLLVTSSLFYGNVGLSLVGPLPIIKEEIGSSQLSPRAKLRVWKLFFDAATFYVVSGTALTVTLHLSVPFLTDLPAVRRLAVASAVTSASAIAYTVLFIAPTNAALGALDKQKDLTEAEEKDSTALIAKWDTRHKIRCAIYAVAWATGLAALLAS